jgi:hypothetical protein
VTTIPPPEPRHGIAELLGLVGTVRRLAFDTSLPPTEAMGTAAPPSPAARRRTSLLP